MSCAKQRNARSVSPKSIHGDDHRTLKVKTSILYREVEERIKRAVARLSSRTPPDLVPNRHCAECEFQTRCREKAIQADDLSLLSGMSEKERKNSQPGIFTVTQLSYTFRPRRRPKRMRDKQERYHHSLNGPGDSGEENPHCRQPGTEDRRYANLFGCRGPA